MPAIKGQTVSSGSFSIDTRIHGLVEVSLSMAGNQANLTMKVDGVTKSSPSINNATASAVDSVINNFLNDNILGVGQSSGDLYSACHTFTLTPTWTYKLRTSDKPLGATWWNELVLS